MFQPVKERKHSKSVKQIFLQPPGMLLLLFSPQFDLLFIVHTLTSAEKQKQKQKHIFRIRIRKP